MPRSGCVPFSSTFSCSVGPESSSEILNWCLGLLDGWFIIDLEDGHHAFYAFFKRLLVVDLHYIDHFLAAGGGLGAGLLGCFFWVVFYPFLNVYNLAHHLAYAIVSP